MLLGAAPNFVDLLPSSSLPLWSDESSEETEGLRRLGDEIYSFDGATTAIEVPSGKLNHTLGDHFTISLWMKHNTDPDNEMLSDAKEHILCNADGDGECMCYLYCVHICVYML